MKSAVKPFRPELEELTRTAREQLAEVAFKDVTVKGLLSAAAKEGRCVCVVSAPLDLSHTEAARKLLAWCDREGLSASWRKGLPPEQDAEAPNNLVINWEKPKAPEQAAKTR